MNDGLLLDEDLARILRQIARAGHPDFSEMTVAQARLMVERNVPVLDVQTRAVAEVVSIAIPRPEADSSPLMARLYRYEAMTPTAHHKPLLLWFHGGGFTVGSLNSYDALCRYMVHYVQADVLSIDYRLAPEHPFPAAVDDALLAWRSVLAHAAQWGYARDRIVVAGDSAGGTLTATLCLLARDVGLAQPTMQVLIYPGTDVSLERPSHQVFADGYFLTKRSLAWFFGHYLPEPWMSSDWRAAPLKAQNHQGIAPTLLIVAGCDMLRDEGLDYANVLEKSGVTIELRCYPSLTHGFFNFGGAIPSARRAIDETLEMVNAIFLR